MAATNGLTTEVQLSLKVKDASNTEIVRNIILSTTQNTQGTAMFPQVIAGSSTNVALNLGGITQGKWLLIETDQEITVKLNNVTDTGFPVDGLLLVKSDTGITGVFVSTGANETCVKLTIVGP